MTQRLKKKIQDTIRVGETSAKLQFPLDESGILEIRASHLAKIPELLAGDTLIRIRPVIRSQKKIKSGAWMPGFELRLVEASLVASAAFPQFVAEETGLLLKSSPQRVLLADGKDAATIHVLRTSFLPTWIGEVKISAATPDLQPAMASLKMTAPNLPLSLSALGGLAGGLIAFWTGQNSKWWRVAIGLIAGFVLYWAFVFGVLNFVSRAIVLNPVERVRALDIGRLVGHRSFRANSQTFWTFNVMISKQTRI